jgi:hypothetical protein
VPRGIAPNTDRRETVYAIIETTSENYQGVTEFIGIQGPTMDDIAADYRQGNHHTVLELVFENQVLAVWTHATSDGPWNQIPEFILNHVNAWALLLQDNNDYPHLDWINHTEAA